MGLRSARADTLSHIVAVSLSLGEYADTVGTTAVDELVARDVPVRLVLIDDCPPDGVIEVPSTLPLIVAVLGRESAAHGPMGADVVVDEVDASDLIDVVERTPVAAVSFALLLRSNAKIDSEAGLLHESATYSMLQNGPEFARWLVARGAHPAPLDVSPTVELDRAADSLHVTLNRPSSHNAINAQLRDELWEALSLAIVDDSIRRVVLHGAGASFSSGGDLREFGTRPEPTSAHLLRLARHPGLLLSILVRRGVHVEARLHGHALGGGIELAAFATEVVATPTTSIGLPEIGLGLIPGAGGTVSIPGRIGRQRTAWLGLTGHRIDRATAVAWGLVDVCVDEL